jgi:DNA-binding NarL/FixJ family response regulator/Tfp pilus assembly protein PilF
MLVFQRVTPSPPPLPDSSTTLDALAALVDHNLVRQEELAEGGPDAGSPRYSLLETIRAFGLEQLARSGGETAIRRRHLEYCLALAEAAEPELTGPGQGEWLDRLEREHGNLRAALDWAADDARSGELALRLATALWRFWDVRGYAAEGRGWLNRMLAHVDAGQAPLPLRLRARALHAAGALAWSLAEFDEAVTAYEAALALWESVGDAREAARTYDHLATVAYQRSELETATGRYLAGLERARRSGDQRLVATILYNLGTVAVSRGDFAAATAAFAESEQILRPLGDAQALSVVLDTQGVVAFRQGRHEDAAALHEESLALCRRLGDRQGIASTIANLAAVALATGDVDRAEALFERALQIFREIGDQRLEAGVWRDLAGVARARGEEARAAALLRQGLDLYHALDNRVGIAECLEGLAGVLTAQERPERAARALGAATALRVAASAPLQAYSRSAYDRAVMATRRRLGEARFAAELAAGRALTIEEAIATTAPSIADHLPAEVGSVPGPAVDPGLTRRERQILLLLVDGRSDREIADHLSIAPRTVSNHVANLLAKLDVDSRTAAATYAVRHGLA